jgi:hypothetical protein
MGTNTPYQCIESFRDALKRAGLEERRADISPGVMAHRLRPKIQARPGPSPSYARRGARRNFSMSFWILILAFALGLVPALVVGAFAWAAKSRGIYETSCSSRMAMIALPTAPLA